MVSFIRGIFNPAYPNGVQSQRHLAVRDTIVAVALSALALITANACEYQSPGLAALLRCTVGGIALIWLFRRCFGNGSYYRHYPSQPPVVIYQNNPPPTIVNPLPPTPPRSYWTGWNWFPTILRSAPVSRPPFAAQPQSHTNYSHASKVPPVPVQPLPPQTFKSGTSFSQWNGPPLHAAPVSRHSSFTPVPPFPSVQSTHSGLGPPMHQAPFRRGG
jgi:hypothetical protein